MRARLAMLVAIILVPGACGRSADQPALRTKAPQFEAGREPATCSALDIPELTGSVPEPPTTIPLPQVPAEDVKAAQLALERVPKASSVVRSGAAEFAYAERWTNRDGDVVGVELRYEFSKPVDLPNLGLPETFEVEGNEEPSPVYNAEGLPKLRHASGDSDSLHHVLSGSFYVTRGGTLYLATGSQEHLYC